VLYVHGGVYREALTHLVLHFGQRAKPISVTNVPGEAPVIRGAVALHRPRYWSFSGLHVTWDPQLRHPPSFMVKITGGFGWSWNDSEFSGSRGAANVFVAGSGTSEPRDWVLAGDCFHGAGGPPGSRTATNLMLGTMADPGRGTVTRDVFFNRGSQENLTIGTGRAAPANVDISYNTIYGGRVAIALRGGPRGVRVTRNLLAGAGSDVLVGFDGTRSPGTHVSQNYGVVAHRGAPGAAVLMRPRTADAIGGSGNVESDSDPRFARPGTCDGFRTTVPALLPYGRYGL
jgi:hypothetical protein